MKTRWAMIASECKRGAPVARSAPDEDNAYGKRV
jgi:hypothetical protein